MPFASFCRSHLCVGTGGFGNQNPPLSVMKRQCNRKPRLMKRQMNHLAEFMVFDRNKNNKE